MSSGVGSVLAPMAKKSVLAYMAFDAVLGGATSDLMGGNFWEGFTTSLMIVGLNHCMHEIEEGLSSKIVEEGKRIDKANTEATLEYIKKNNLKAPDVDGVSQEYINNQLVSTLKKRLVFDTIETKSFMGETIYRSRVVGYKLITNKGVASQIIDSQSTGAKLTHGWNALKAARNKSIEAAFDVTRRAQVIGTIMLDFQPLGLNSVPLTTQQQVQLYVDLHLNSLTRWNLKVK